MGSVRQSDTLSHERTAGSACFVLVMTANVLAHWDLAQRGVGLRRASLSGVDRGTSMATATPLAERPRLLIADDQQDIRDALKLALREDNFLIEVAGSPAAVLCCS